MTLWGKILVLLRKNQSIKQITYLCVYMYMIYFIQLYFIHPYNTYSTGTPIYREVQKSLKRGLANL